MAYASTLEIARYSGLAIDIVDENVGTGDNAEDSYDLDKDNIIAGSYTLSYAASGSNDFTDLTETTDYTLDKSSGRILLTAGGITTLGTNILYASYTYTDKFSDDFLATVQNASDDEVDHLTGKKWDTPTSVVEYYDGKRSLAYPYTDHPYSYDDFIEPDYLNLKNQKVTQIESIYFLSVQSVAQFWNYDDNLATYTDYTENVNTTDSAQFTLFAATPATSDIVYIGSASRFLGLDVSLTTLGTGTPAITWEYWDGSTWSSLTVTEVDTDSSTFEQTGRFTWSLPSSWTRVAVNGSNEYFYVRGRLTSGYTIAPVCNAIALYDALSEVVHPRDYVFDNRGKVSFVGNSIPDGMRNIRISYSYGEVTTPPLITELSSLLAGIALYANITGGSYNDATSYNLGSKSVTVGEVYVNVREVVRQYEVRVKELIRLIGRRVYITS